VTDENSNKPTAGWYADPRVPYQLRWWDGDGWTTNVYMPDRGPQPLLADLIPELADDPDGKWTWPQ
jgi:Protein of unknown function (DUF2510)